jgi:hypothetical protein
MKQLSRAESHVRAREGKNNEPDGFPDDSIGGPGFFNDEDLVWRGYAEWSATGRKPTKEEIERLDEQWEHDLTMAARLVSFAANKDKDPVTGQKLNVG